MPYWNHRVVKQHLEDGTDWLSVREVHYNDDGTIYAYTQDPVDISGESIEEMREYCQWVMNCLDKEILVDGEVMFVDRDEDELVMSRRDKASQFVADTLNRIAVPFWRLADKYQNEDYWGDRKGIWVRIGDFLEDLADPLDVRLMTTLKKCLKEAQEHPERLIPIDDKFWKDIEDGAS